MNLHSTYRFTTISPDGTLASVTIDGSSKSQAGRFLQLLGHKIDTAEKVER